MAGKRVLAVGSDGFPKVVNDPDQILAPDGSASAPGLLFGTNGGLFNDTTHTSVGVSSGGVQIGWFGPNGPVYQIAGGTAVTPLIQAESTVGYEAYRYGTSAAPVFLLGKARGTIASPTVALLNDALGSIGFQPWTGAAFSTAGRIRYVVTETSAIDPTHMGCQFQIGAVPIGSGTFTDVAYFDNENGLQMFGSNPVIDQNRVFRPRAYATASVPAVTATGLVQVTDEGGGTCLAYMDGTSTRRTNDGQVIVAGGPSARGLLSLMTTRVSYVNQDYVHRTFQKLSDAGLLTKLKGLWVFAGIPGSSADACRNWVNPGVGDLTISGSPTWSQTAGFTGDGSASLLTSTTLGTLGTTQDSTAIGAYVLTASATTAAIIGANNAAAQRRLILQSGTSGSLITRLNDTTNDPYTPPRYTGMFTLSRTGSTGFNDSVDDSAATTFTRASTGLQLQNICFLGNNDATGSAFSTAQLLFAFAATGLTAADIAHLRAIMVDYLMVSLGIVTATVSNLPPALDFSGQTYYVPNLGGGAGLLQSDSVNWFRAGSNGYEARTIATGSETITYLTNAGNVEYTSVLTGNTTVTLAGTDAKGTTVKKGAEFEITRSGLGAFTFAIVNGGGGGGTLVTFASLTAKAARCVFNGTDWRLMMDSNL